jgi:hypothetical protein
MVTDRASIARLTPVNGREADRTECFVCGDVATAQQIGPAMKHDGAVYGALLTKDESRIMSWSDDNTLRHARARLPQE